MTTLLSAGLVHSLTQDVVYALPGKKVFILADNAIEVSNSIGSGFATLTGANTTGASTSAAFVRCTTGDTIISVKVD